MTLQQFEYILAVDKFRHFTKAAEFCNVTQPTLSSMIQKLEDELDVKIFDRTQQPIVPTPAGAIIIKQAKEILDKVSAIPEILKEAEQSVSGSFSIGILPTIAPYLLPRFFPSLSEKFPNLDIRVSEMKTGEIKKALITGDIDAGILADLSDMDDYNITHLYYEQFLAYVSRGSALFGHDSIKTNDLAKELLWMLDEGHCFRDQLVKFCQLKTAQASQLSYNLGSMETFMRMVESGKGITFIPALATHQLSDAQKELVKPFSIPRPTRRIVFLTNKNFIRFTILNALVKEIQNSIPKSMISLTTSQVAI